MSGRPCAPDAAHASATIAASAVASLTQEIELWPKPGLVSPKDSGSHDDMDAATMMLGARALQPFFAELATAGARDADMDELRSIGIAAEVAMMSATGGVNTHRGAIFGLGLLCAAAGAQASGTAREATLGSLIAARWSAAIGTPAWSDNSHGAAAWRHHHVGGARAEAANGMPTLYLIGLPALHEGRRLAPFDADAASIQALFALIATVNDTNLLHRGGANGLAFAKREASAFLAGGGVARPDWREIAIGTHARFVERRLSPGGAADLLAMTLFVDNWENGG